jgi:hypothetical protein
VFDLIYVVLQLAGMADNPHPAEAKLAELLGRRDRRVYRVRAGFYRGQPKAFAYPLPSWIVPLCPHPSCEGYLHGSDLGGVLILKVAVQN